MFRADTFQQKASVVLLYNRFIPFSFFYSTGVGRTGAFIALYVMLARLTKENTVDIYNYVQYMRKQRISMVSNEVHITALYATKTTY